MKVKVILTAIVLMASLITVQAQENIFGKFSNNKDISTVYLSKALLSMMPNTDMVATNVNGTNINGLVNKLETMEIYTSENNSGAVKLMQTEMESIAKKNKYEVLMNIKDGEESITFYALKGKDKNSFKDLVMHMSEPTESTIIHIVGNFTTEDLQGIMKDKKE